MTNSRTPKVYIVTWCRSAELLYGSTLTFETLRVGFPDAEVTVVENASHPDLRPPIHAAARAAGCEILQLEEQQHHWALIEGLVLGETQPTVLLDPDIVMWEKASDWDFGDKLMIGRHLPEFADPYTDTLTLPRLHTSHLWFPDPVELKARIAAIQQRRFEAGSLFQPRMAPPGWWRWDTAAALYHALGEAAASFSEAQLDAYDHLFCGSHLDLVAPKMGAWGALMSDSHARSQTDPRLAQGHLAATATVLRIPPLEWPATERFAGAHAALKLPRLNLCDHAPRR